MILVLFFTRGMKLEHWIESGIFDREKLIYEEHLKQLHLKKIYWITYGSYDKKIAENLKNENRLHQNIEICSMPLFFNIPKVGSYLYSLFMPFYYHRILKNCDILKTNQMNGSWSALISKFIYKKTLLLRTGFTQSIFLTKQKKGFFRIMFSKYIEKLMYTYCDYAIIGSKQDKEYICNSYKIESTKIEVLYNYIDLNLFHDFNLKRNSKLIFVGRLAEQKNLFSLIDAIDEANVELDIYGNGELEKELKKIVHDKNINISFKGIVSNKKLPTILNNYKYYILPSYYEGMPKTLLEAMACGCVCLGTDVEGINEVIKDRYNGFLSEGTDKESLVSLLSTLSVKIKEYDDITSNAIMTIKDRFSLEAIVTKEYEIMKSLV